MCGAATRVTRADLLTSNPCDVQHTNKSISAGSQCSVLKKNNNNIIHSKSELNLIRRQSDSSPYFIPRAFPKVRKNIKGVWASCKSGDQYFVLVYLFSKSHGEHLRLKVYLEIRSIPICRGHFCFQNRSSNPSECWQHLHKMKLLKIRFVPMNNVAWIKWHQEICVFTEEGKQTRKSLDLKRCFIYWTRSTNENGKNVERTEPQWLGGRHKTEKQQRSWAVFTFWRFLSALSKREKERERKKA